MNIFNKIKQKRRIRDTEVTANIRLILCEWLREVDPSNTRNNIGIVYRLSRLGTLELYSAYPGTLIGKEGKSYYKYRAKLIDTCKGIRDVKLYEIQTYVDRMDAEI